MTYTFKHSFPFVTELFMRFDGKEREREEQEVNGNRVRALFQETKEKRKRGKVRL